eukprot:EC793984.1.p1 GENE.EC793984.1~~EC793984.1.p1  ORF type:complete len:158 (+),score=47.58 EC793984.1:27-500(+)
MRSALRPLETPPQRSVTLQVALFYHAFFVVLYVPLTILVETWRIDYFGLKDLPIAIIASGLMAPVEWGRISLGYSGNLRESGWRLFFFCVLSVVPLGIAGYLGVVGPKRMPFDMAPLAVVVIFVVVEVASAVRLLWIFFQNLTRRYYLLFDRHGALV